MTIDIVSTLAKAEADYGIKIVCVDTKAELSEANQPEEITTTKDVADISESVSVYKIGSMAKFVDSKIELQPNEQIMVVETIARKVIKVFADKIIPFVL
jgi:ribosomal protein L7Ae-like RNA K-turn-binding protein